MERLQKYLAKNGVASRRKAEEYITKGRVKVNGELVTMLGTKVDPEIDIVEVDGKIVKIQEEKVYILLNKPIGYVTTAKDQFNRDTVLDLVKEINKKLVPVGRLDMYTSGAIFLTNDGDFVYYITHPKNEIEKTYIATVRGIITVDEIEKLKNGVEIDTYVSRKSESKDFKSRCTRKYFEDRNNNS